MRKEEGNGGKGRGHKKGTSGLEHVCMDKILDGCVSVQLSIWIPATAQQNNPKTSSKIIKIV
jgi:hypothetical protein